MPAIVHSAGVLALLETLGSRDPELVHNDALEPGADAVARELRVTTIDEDPVAQWEFWKPDDAVDVVVALDRHRLGAIHVHKVSALVANEAAEGKEEAEHTEYATLPAAGLLGDGDGEEVEVERLPGPHERLTHGQDRAAHAARLISPRRGVREVSQRVEVVEVCAGAVEDVGGEVRDRLEVDDASEEPPPVHGMAEVERRREAKVGLA